MSILKVAKIGHPILLEVASEIKNFSRDSLRKIVYNMSETMIDYNGIGLAAPQVHISKRIIILRNLSDDNSKKINITALVNPEYKPIGDETENDWEGCLSIPGMLGLVKRYKRIDYTGFDLEGNKIEDKAEGLSAKVIQHEVDHLNGILYINRLADKKAFGFENEINKYWKNLTNEK